MLSTALQCRGGDAWRALLDRHGCECAYPIKVAEYYCEHGSTQFPHLVYGAWCKGQDCRRRHRRKRVLFRSFNALLASEPSSRLIPLVRLKASRVRLGALRGLGVPGAGCSVDLSGGAAACARRRKLEPALAGAAASWAASFSTPPPGPAGPPAGANGSRMGRRGPASGHPDHARGSARGAARAPAEPRGHALCGPGSPAWPVHTRRMRVATEGAGQPRHWRRLPLSAGLAVGLRAHVPSSS
jgi:hypothetical protein